MTNTWSSLGASLLFSVSLAACAQHVDVRDRDAAAPLDASTDAASIRDGGTDAPVAADAGHDAAVSADAGHDAAASIDAARSMDTNPVDAFVAADVGTDARSAVDGNGVDVSVGGPGTYLLGALGQDCNAACSAVGLVCAGAGSVGLDCHMHAGLLGTGAAPTAACSDPAAWIYRQGNGGGDPMTCCTSWGTCDPCTNNYNVVNAFCCRCQ